MITFECVRWKNFLSTGNNFTEIQLNKESTTLIIGENGAGKSTVLDAICFGLFGKPFRNIKKPQLLNTINGSGCIVEVEFKVSGKSIKVVRGIKPNVFEIYIGGKMYNQDANARDYQKYLEQQILKLNYRSFTQVVILGSSTFVPFMQLKAQHRRDVVEEILDIQIFSLMNMILKQKLKTIDDNIKDIDYKLDLASEKVSLKEKRLKILANINSLGQGLSVSIGAALTKKMNGEKNIVYSLHGDGELQEGQNWEAIMYAAANKVDNLICTIDNNNKQIDGDLNDVLDLGNIDSKFKSFGWLTINLENGNDIDEVKAALIKAKEKCFSGKPVVIIMKTVMGNGVDYMMGTHKWHGVAPNDKELEIALNQNPETLNDY